jgi:hypothetical protein
LPPPPQSTLRTSPPDKPLPPSSSGGPLSSFSPALSPIARAAGAGGRGFRDNEDNGSVERNKGSSISMFDESHIEDDEREDSSAARRGGESAVNLSASLFMSPLHYDSSDADGSLQSLSLLNVTSNTTLASGAGLLDRPGREDRGAHALPSPHHSHSSRPTSSSGPRKKKSPSTRYVRLSVCFSVCMSVSLFILHDVSKLLRFI